MLLLVGCDRPSFMEPAQLMRRRDDREYSRCLTFLTWSNEGRARKLLTSLSILYLCGKGTRAAHRLSVKIILALLRAVLRVWKRARANVARHSSASIMLMIFGLDEGLDEGRTHRDSEEKRLPSPAW